MPGYSPRFVRGVALADWGEMPADVQVLFRSSVLSALRRAARGERVATLLDRAQTAALDSLPFAGELEVVVRSRPLPGTLLCRVGGRLPDEHVAELKQAFLGLERQPGGRALLDTLRIVSFEPNDTEALAGAVRAFTAAGAEAR